MAQTADQKVKAHFCLGGFNEIQGGFCENQVDIRLERRKMKIFGAFGVFLRIFKTSTTIEGGRKGGERLTASKKSSDPGFL